MRKKLLSIGLTMAILGFLGLFVFLALGVSMDFKHGEFILCFLCAVVGVIGSDIAHLGFKILVTEYTSNLIDENIGNNCPKCGDVITEEELFCSKCGEKLKNECPNCKTINTIDTNYCSKCGTELNK